MSRSLVFLREAVAADGCWLAELWADLLRRGDEHDRLADMAQVICTAPWTPTSASSWPSTTAGSRGRCTYG